MSAKRKSTARKSAASAAQPQSIRLKEFLRIFRDTEPYATERAFCFILGSGSFTFRES